MRAAPIAILIVSVLSAQVQPNEAKVPVGGGELRYFYSASAAKAPLLVILPGVADDPGVRNLFAQWQLMAASRGWNCVMPFITGVSDQAVKALELILADAKKRLAGVVNETSVYLAGQGASSADVFYALSREPDLWAAALAIQGSPGPAINTFRLYGANTQLAPLLWIAPPSELELYKAKLSAAEFNFEARQEVKTDEAFDWLAKHQLPAFPATIDCETGSPTFAHCYWIEMTNFDPKKRNDVLKSSRVMAGSGAWLEVGPFGYDFLAPGPGAPVTYLPPNYQGPLKMNDRIVSIAGKEIRDGRDYARQMDEMKEAKSVAVMIQRGKDKVRLETKILLPKREELVSARAQGRYLSDQKELLLITRAVTEMRVRVPVEWTPVSVSWNGLDMVKAESAGCWVLSIEKDPPGAVPCR